MGFINQFAGPIALGNIGYKYIYVSGSDCDGVALGGVVECELMWADIGFRRLGCRGGDYVVFLWVRSLLLQSPAPCLPT